MAIATRQAETEWVGSLASGGGMLSAGSRAFAPLPVTWASRTEQPDRKTSPEELIAAAHSSCLAMNFSGVLAGENLEAEYIDVSDDGKRVANARLVIDAGPGTPDGIRVDVQGHLWCGF